MLLLQDSLLIFLYPIQTLSFQISARKLQRRILGFFVIPNRFFLDTCFQSNKVLSLEILPTCFIMFYGRLLSLKRMNHIYYENRSIQETVTIFKVLSLSVLL